MTAMQELLSKLDRNMTNADWIAAVEAEYAHLAAWKSAIDHELVVSLNTCADAYSDPRKAINDLIAWHIAVATDERVNGGKRLVDIASLRRAFGFEDTPAPLLAVEEMK